MTTGVRAGVVAGLVVALAAVVGWFALRAVEGPGERPASLPSTGTADAAASTDSGPRETTRPRAARPATEREASAEPEPDDELVRESPPPARVLRGRVLESGTEAPVAGATVRVLEETAVRADFARPGASATQTDSAGTFAVEFDADVSTARLRAAAPGFAPVSVEVDARGADPTILLERAGRVVGAVRDASGTPVRGAVVEVAESGEEETPPTAANPSFVTTDAAGGFSVDGLRFGWTYRLRARTADGSASGEVAGLCVNQPATEVRADVVLRATGSVRVRQQGAARPATGATVLLARGRDVHHEGTLDGRGEARLSAVDAGGWKVLVLADGAQPWRGEAEVASGAETVVTAELAPEWTVAGVVVDELGRPAETEGLHIAFDRAPELRTAAYYVHVPVAADGTFRVPGYGPGLRGVSVWSGSRPVADFDVEAPAEDLRFVVPRFLRVRFRFTPREDLWIGWDAIDEEGEEVAHDYEEYEGGREVTLRVPHCARLRLCPDGHLPVVRALAAAPGGEVDLGEIAFDPGATLAARVVDPDGKPVPDARVLVWTSDDTLESGQTAQDGTVAVPGLARDRHVVEVETPGLLREEIPVDLREPGEKTIRLRRGGVVRATAVDAAGRAAEDLRLVVVDDHEYEVAESEAGRPLVARVRPGRWTVVARREVDDVGSATVDVAEGGVHDVVVRLER